MIRSFSRSTNIFTLSNKLIKIGIKFTLSAAFVLAIILKSIVIKRSIVNGLYILPDHSDYNFIFTFLLFLLVTIFWDRLIADINNKQSRYTLSFLFTFLVINLYFRAFFTYGYPPLDEDAAFFQHAGWLIRYQQFIPYIHIWDIKPPGVYYLTSMLTLISGSNFFYLHLLSTLSTLLSALACILLVSKIAIHLSNNSMAGFVAGISLISFTYFTTFSLVGARPKYHALFFGLLSIQYILSKKNYFLAGIFGGLAGWFYAPTIMFAMFGFILTTRDGIKKFGGYLLGIFSISIAAIIPILVWSFLYPQYDVLGSMILEIIFTPSKIIEPAQMDFRFFMLRLFLKTNWITIFFSFIGIIVISIKNLRKYWWVLVGLLFSVYFLTRDFDGPPDLFHIFIFIPIITGLLYHHSPKWFRIMILSSSLFVLFVSIAWIGSIEGIYTPSTFRNAAFRTNPPSERVEPSMQTLYLYGVLPEKCHYRLSSAELVWVEYNHLDPNAQICGMSEFPQIQSLTDLFMLSPTDR